MVPVFKGTTGVEGDIIIYDDGNSRKWDTKVVPVFHGTDDESVIRHGGGIDNWSNFIPITGVWTTERNYYQPPSSDRGKI